MRELPPLFIDVSRPAAGGMAILALLFFVLSIALSYVLSATYSLFRKLEPGQGRRPRGTLLA